jgi:hypothetical protein
MDRRRARQFFLSNDDNIRALGILCHESVKYKKGETSTVLSLVAAKDMNILPRVAVASVTFSSGTGPADMQMPTVIIHCICCFSNKAFRASPNVTLTFYTNFVVLKRQDRKAIII